MWRNILLSAVVICVFWGAVAQADIFVSLDGEDLSNSIALADYPGQFILAIEGNTSFGPNDISVEVENGTLEPVGDSNTSYYFQFNAEGEATVNLITKVDMTIDGHFIPSDTLIYQLWLCYNAGANIYAAVGIGLTDLIPPEEELVQQDEPPSEDINDTTEVIQEEPNAIEPLPEVDYNLPPLKATEQELQKVLLNCPNRFDDATHTLISETETDSGEGGGQSMLDGVIGVSSNITTNQIWTANNTYHITAGINVRALLVIEPGTIVEFASGTWMSVNNGGTLISAGTPDNPIIYTSDKASPGYGDYTCAILIEETASPSTKVTYSYIEYAEEGIWVNNNRLDSPIENNCLYSNLFGILEYGVEHTDIYNNLVYASYYEGIEINMESYSGQSDANSHIIIQNNTCDYYQDVGIVIYGVANQADAGEVTLKNNIVSESYQYGIVLANGWVSFTFICTGYYGNAANRFGYGEPNEYNPVYETNMPYVDGSGILPFCYLRQDCNFINKGYEYIEQTRLIGKTTDVNGFPDSNKTDIGFHYPNWDFSNVGEGNTLTADLNHDLTVDFKDFAVLAAGWQTDYNINDLNIMADQWLRYGEPNIQIQILGDSNDGYVDVDFIGSTPDILRIFLLVDGQYIGEKSDLDISALGSGIHELKAISIDTNDKIICSNLKQSSFSCPFNYCSSRDSYDSNEPYNFYAFYQGSGNITVKVYDEDSNLVWSQAYSVQNLNGFIPSIVTSRNDLDSIVYEPPAGGGSAIKKPFTMKFNPKKVPAGIRGLFVLPYTSINWSNWDVEGAVEGALKTHSVPYYKLKVSNATYDNLAWFANNYNIEYLYYAGHGEYRVGKGDNQVLRTTIGLYDGNVVSAKKSDFPPGSAPSWCVPLPSSDERTLHSICRLGFASRQRLKFVYIDCCLAGRLRLTSSNSLVESLPGQQGLLQIPDSDMSWALGMNGSYDQFYQGWWCEIEKSPFFTPITDTFSVIEWTKLKEGENFFDALNDTITEIRNHEYEEKARDNFRIYGRGLMSAVKIE